MNWLHYLLEANLYLAVFYAGYYLFLSKETYYTLNRIYLLFSCAVSFALPLIQLGILKPVEQPLAGVTFAFPVQAVAVDPIKYVPAAPPLFTWENSLVYAYCLGAAVLFILLLVKLYQLYRLTRVKSSGSNDHYKLVYIDKSATAFSFFNYLFIGTQIQEPETIIKHELVHIRQMHSADIIFIELLKIVNWFNPVIYMLQYSLKTLHEYIADEKTAASETDALIYSSFLVNNAYGIDGVSITNSFFNYNLLKKRIIMLNQKRSGSLARLKYLLAVPIFGGLLCVSTLAFSKTYGWVDIGPNRIVKLSPDTIKAHLPPPPSPAPPVRAVAKRPPPPPPSPPVCYTSKGYKYTEDGYLINGKTDFRVIITEKNGNQKEYFKSKASIADIKYLKNKYGYKFPEMQIYTKMPPPPPEPPAKTGSIKSIKLDGENVPDDITLNDVTFSRKRPTDYKAINPLIIVNGVKYYTIGKLDDKHKIGFSASDSIVVFKDNLNTLNKLGADAAKGAFYLYGTVELTVTDKDISKDKL